MAKKVKERQSEGPKSIGHLDELRARGRMAEHRAVGFDWNYRSTSTLTKVVPCGMKLRACAAA